MATKTTTKSKATPKAKRPNKIDVEIMQADQEAYNMLIESIAKNKRLHWRIVARWLDVHKEYLIPRAQADADFTRKYPKLAKKLKSI